ncbi:hypothetical protein QZH41_020745 [Actinostola sp. cb2023]|nr:hypothetical protein QZH41_020745 [Actinostola sp. cb2023]
MADAMEVTILAIMSPAIRCEWKLSNWAEASISTVSRVVAMVNRVVAKVSLMVAKFIRVVAKVSRVVAKVSRVVAKVSRVVAKVVFAGMTISTCFWGYISDKFGRKKELMWCTIIVFIGGFLSTFSPSYIWMVLLRGIVGLGLGGVAQAVNLWLEFLPARNRGGLVTMLMISWSIGTCIEVALAVVVMPTLGWRWLLFFSSLPLIVLLVLLKFIPESPRFLVGSGQNDKALEILQKVAKDNKAALPPGKLVAPTSSTQVGVCITTTLYSTTITVLKFSSHFVIYGIALITTEMFSREDECRGIHIDDSVKDKHNGCKPLDTHDYLHYFVIMSSDLLGFYGEWAPFGQGFYGEWVTCGQDFYDEWVTCGHGFYVEWVTCGQGFYGIVLCLATIDRIGRKYVQALSFVGSAIFLAALFICTRSRFVTTMFLYGARLFISVADLAGYVYTPEIYPTSIRGVALGACNCAARIGCMITPFVAMVLMPAATTISIALYFGFAATAIIAVILLPIETKGRALQVGLLI